MKVYRMFYRMSWTPTIIIKFFLFFTASPHPNNEVSTVSTSVHVDLTGSLDLNNAYEVLLDVLPDV